MKTNYVLLTILVIFIILTGIYYTLEQIQRERCYNMPINRYVEDKNCEKYTWEQYMEEHYGK